MNRQEGSPDALLADYARGPASLREALTGAGEGALDLALPSGGWTVRQIVHHVADGDDLWKACILAALGEPCVDSALPGAVFGLQWYWDRPQDDWVERWAYRERAIEPALALLEANRRRTVQLLRHVPDSLARCIVIRWPGGQEQEVTVGWVVEMQTRHVQGHIEQVQGILEAAGPPQGR
jgi:hypothetical protein